MSAQLTAKTFSPHSSATLSSLSLVRSAQFGARFSPLIPSRVPRSRRMDAGRHPSPFWQHQFLAQHDSTTPFSTGRSQDHCPTCSICFSICRRRLHNAGTPSLCARNGRSFTHKNYDKRTAFLALHPVPPFPGPDESITRVRTLGVRKSRPGLTRKVLKDESLMGFRRRFGVCLQVTLMAS